MSSRRVTFHSSTGRGGASNPANPGSSANPTTPSTPVIPAAPAISAGPTTAATPTTPAAATPAATALTITPTVISACDYITNKQIKIPMLENSTNSGIFRVWLIKFEKYLDFIKVIDVWKTKYENRPTVANGSPIHEVEQWLEKDKLIAQLLFQAVGNNKITDGYITQTAADPWRKTWSLITQFFIPTGNNATATQSKKISDLVRYDTESFRNFIARIDGEMANLRALGGDQPEYVLTGLLRDNADTEYRTLILISINKEEPYEIIRDELLKLLPHPSQKKSKYHNNQVNSVTINNKSREKVFKANNSIKKSNPKYQNNIRNLTNNKQLKSCIKCNLFGHTHKECRTDMSKKCASCNKMGHLAHECRSRRNTRNYNQSSNNYQPQFPQQYMITQSQNQFPADISTYNTNTTNNGQTLNNNNVLPTDRPIRTVTFNTQNSSNNISSRGNINRTE